MAGKNRITRSNRPLSIFEGAKVVIGASTSFNQGDLLIFDAGDATIKHAAVEADGAGFVGIATTTVVNGKVASPYNTDVVASQAVSEIAGPVHGVTAKLVLKTGDALAPGALVYLNPAAGAYHVQAAGTKAIGVMVGPAVVSAVAGQEVEILLGCCATYAALGL
jgi:hypothetical protein